VVVDQVDQVTADQQRVGAGRRPPQGVGGAVDVGDDLDADGCPSGRVRVPS
jgi:hypothetical protein